MGSLTRNAIRRNVAPYAPPTIGTAPRAIPAAPRLVTTPSPASAPKPARKPALPAAAPADGLVLLIGGVGYQVEKIDREPGDEATALVRLHKSDGITVYDVATTGWGHECDCPDWVYRRDGLDPSGC